jgi:LPS-assembly protein
LPVPNPWWRLKGPRFNVVPQESARAYRSVFLLRKFPLFYTPFFYKSLEKVPRRTGLLMPNIGHSSTRGFMLGAGAFWAINRSYDATYHVQDYTARGFAHHLELRGKPTDKADFDAILFGVQDRGLPQPTGRSLKQGGYLRGGRQGRAGRWFLRPRLLDQLPQLLYFPRGIFRFLSTKLSSDGELGGVSQQDWSSYTFDTVVERQQNFQSLEIVTTNPVTGQTETLAMLSLLSKLPEVDFSSRDHQIWENLPVWFSFESSGGLLYRSQPYFNGGTLTGTYQTGRFQQPARTHGRRRSRRRFHWGDFHLVPSFTVDETFYGSQSQDALRRPFPSAVSEQLAAQRPRVQGGPDSPSLRTDVHRKTWLGDKLKHVIEPRVTYQNTSPASARISIRSSISTR